MFPVNSEKGWKMRFKSQAALFVIALLGTSAGHGSSPTTSQGSATQDETAVLWQDGQRAFDTGGNAECIRNLQRLVDRHPGAPGYLRAHLMLGLCYLRTGHPDKSLVPLKHYVEASSLNPDGIRARLALTRAEVGLGRYNEALLLTTELMGKSIAGPDRLEALILKARALLGMDEDLRASQAIASFKKESEGLGALSPLTEEASLVELQIKIRSCSRLPEKGHVDEGKIRAQFKARGQCLQEAILLLKTSVQTLSAPEWLEKSLNQVVDAVDALRHWVDAKLPEPPGKRKSAQKSAYEKELRTALHEDLSDFATKSKELLAEWRKNSPPIAAKYIDPILKVLP